MQKNTLKLNDLIDLLDPDRMLSVYHEFEDHNGVHNLYHGRVKYFNEETDAKHYGEYEVKKIDFSASKGYYIVRI